MILFEHSKNSKCKRYKIPTSSNLGFFIIRINGTTQKETKS